MPRQPTVLERLRSAWNVFNSPEPPYSSLKGFGASYATNPDRIRFSTGNERSLLTSIFTRIGIDVAAIPIFHARLDDNSRMIDVINSGLNNCLQMSANLDQTGRAFIQDTVMKLCDNGTVAIVPVDTSSSPMFSNSYDIYTLRSGRIIEWFPEHVRIELYDERDGLRKPIKVLKEKVVIIENPLYSVMNEPNSILRRLVDKMNLLDVVDNQSGSGKLDLIVQLPYVIKSQARQDQADARRASIEAQLKDSKYGIAYTDATEKITQLNRPAENNLMTQIEYLTRMLYGQLGMTEGVFNGTANESEMLNYYSRSIEPILSSLTDGMKRTFLSKTARSQGQSIIAIRDPFRLVPAEKLADIGDKMTRNEILSSNEMRGIIGFRPRPDPSADELRNKNINQPEGEVRVSEGSPVQESPIKIEGV